MSMSLDGFVAGPDQTRENPIGIRGMELHHWHFDPMHEADIPVRDHLLAPKGAYIMGRNMFGPIRGEWTDDWRGWWGDEPPYHAPVFVLTHHARDPVEMQGGTTFHFVTDGFESALEQARAVAGGAEIDVAGGASAVRQGFQSRAIDELMIDVVPVLLGAGERIFDDIGRVQLQQVEVVHSPHVAHIRYEVSYPQS